jgi:hypothetical protein
MAEVTIRFRFNRKTGQKDMVISYESEDDALPHEHERDHRALAEQLLGQKLDDDVGEGPQDVGHPGEAGSRSRDIIVERVTKKQHAEEDHQEALGERKAQKEKG